MNQNIFKRSKELRDGGASVEEILRHLRESNLSIVESMQMLKALMDMSLAEAKHIVHFSETWADTRDEHDRFHRVLDDVVNTVDNETES